MPDIPTQALLQRRRAARVALAQRLERAVSRRATVASELSRLATAQVKNENRSRRPGTSERMLPQSDKERERESDKQRHSKQQASPLPQLLRSAQLQHRLVTQMLATEKQRVISHLRLALPLHWKRSDCGSGPVRRPSAPLLQEPEYICVCGAVLPVGSDFSRLPSAEVSAGLGCVPRDWPCVAGTDWSLQPAAALHRAGISLPRLPVTDGGELPGAWSGCVGTASQ